MKAILLENVYHKGRRYIAGDELNLDAVTAGNFERAGIAIIDAPSKQADAATELPPVAQIERSTGDKPPKSKKAARGKK